MKPPVHRCSTVTPAADVEDFTRLRGQSVHFRPESTSKLLVLSLNGDLGYKVMIGQFLPRPFLGNIMKYIRHRYKSGPFNQSNEPTYSVFIWSAMVPHNVQPCVDALIGPWKSLLVGVWDRTKLDLDESQYCK